jgi:hypothetical protein
MNHASYHTGESRPARWLVRFVIVPVVAAAIGASIVYIVRGPDKGGLDVHEVDLKPVRGELFAAGTLALLSEEATDSVSKRHCRVEAAMANGIENKDFSKALELSTGILKDYPESPRANYDRACIYSLLAGTVRDSETRALYLDRSQEALQEALDYGLTNYQKLFNHALLPVNNIQTDSDLATLLKERPGVVKLLEKYSTEDKPRRNAIGGGCIGIQMGVLVSSGIYQPIGTLSVGDTVMSIDSKTGRQGAGRVSRLRRLHVKQVLRLNHSLVFTASHPIKTPEGWSPCGNLQPGASICLASGQQEAIHSVELLTGDFEVVDLTVEPYETFIVNGIVVHNKCCL